MNVTRPVFVTAHKKRKNQELLYQVYEHTDFPCGTYKDKKTNNKEVKDVDKENDKLCTCNNQVDEYTNFPGGANKGNQIDSKGEVKDKDVCTCKNVKEKRRKEMRYSDVPLIYVHGSTCAEIGVGSVKKIQRRIVKKVYLPETRDRGIGSSDLSSFICKQEQHKTDISDHRRNSSKCVGGESNIRCVINDKLSPITQTKSKISPELANAHTGSNTIEKTLQTIGTQFENTKEVENTVKEEKIEEPITVSEADKEEKIKTFVKELIKKSEQKSEHKNKKGKKKLEKFNSSDSLVQHVHNLEDPSFDKQSKTSFQDPMENKLEREYRKMFSINSQESRYERQPEKSASALRRRFEVLRRGIAKDSISQKKNAVVIKSSTQESLPSHKDASITSDPPSLIARSLSSTNKFSPIVANVEQEKIKAPSTTLEVDRLLQKSIASDSQGVKGMFKLWGNKFNFDEQMTVKQNNAHYKTDDGKKKKVPKEVPKVTQPTKKEGKKFFFFKKKNKKVEPVPLPPQSYQPQKDVTTARCEISSPLMPGTPKEKASLHSEGDITRRTWFKKYICQDMESARSVNIRWCNNLYATSSSTLFELMDTVYKNYGVAIKSRSDTSTEASSYYKSFTKHKVNFLQDIEAWMVPKTIPDIKTKPMKERNVIPTVSKLRWYIEKTEAYSHNIEIVLHSRNTKSRGKISSEYLRIDIPKDFFDSSCSVIKGNHSSDTEEVYKIVEYETTSDIRNAKDKGDQPSITVKVNVKDSKAEESTVPEKVKKPPCRDVLIQGSNVNISKRCDVIGVGIITQRDIMREIPKPILKIQDDLTDDDDSPPDQITHKKCEFAKSYLQDCCRDLYSWCPPNTLRSSSEKSLRGLDKQENSSKSCSNILNDIQTIPLSSSSHYGELRDCFIFKKDKLPPSPNSKADDNPMIRVVPKDSLNVFMKRKLYACSNKAQWLSACDKMVPCPSKESRHRQMANKCNKRVKLPDCEEIGAPNVGQCKETNYSPQQTRTPDSEHSCETCKLRGTCCEKHATIIPEPTEVINTPPCEEVCEKSRKAPCNVPNAPPCTMIHVKDLPQSQSCEDLEVRRVNRTSNSPHTPTCPSALPCNKELMKEIKKTKQPASSPGCPAQPCTPPPCQPPPNASPCTSPSPCPLPPCLDNLSPQVSPKKTPLSSCKPAPTLCDRCTPRSTPSKKASNNSCQRPPCASACCNPNKRKSPVHSPSIKFTTPPCMEQISQKPSACSFAGREQTVEPQKMCQQIPILRYSPRTKCKKPPPCPPCRKASPRHIPISPRGSPPAGSLKCFGSDSRPNSPPARKVQCSKPSPCKPKNSDPCSNLHVQPEPSNPSCSACKPFTCPGSPNISPRDTGTQPSPCDTPVPRARYPSTPPPTLASQPADNHPQSSPKCKERKQQPCQTDPTICQPKPASPCASNQSLLTQDAACSTDSDDSIRLPNRTSPGTKNVPKKLKKQKFCDTPPCDAINRHQKCDPTGEYPWPMKNQVSNPPSPGSSQSDISQRKCKSSCTQKHEPEKIRKKIGLPDESKPNITGVHLKMKPSPKAKTCSSECLSWNNNGTDGVLNLDPLERVIIKLKHSTESTEEIREGMNIKVKDETGRTLYERKDYGCGKNKPILREEESACFNTGPVIFTNVTETQVDQDLLQEKSNSSLESLIEIQLKLRVAQGNNQTAELNIENGDEGLIEKSDFDKQSDVFVVKKEAKTKQVNEKNDMSIKITVRNLNQKPQKAERSKKTEEFSKKISHKFLTVSTGSANVNTGNDDENVFSIHRATIDVSSSIEKSSNICIGDTIPAQDFKDKVSTESVKQPIEEESASKKDSESEILEEITETISELPDFNDTDEQDASILCVTSNEDQQITQNEKKALLKIVGKRAHRTQSKDKATVRQLKNMLKIILTDSSDNNEINNSTSELVKDVTYTSLKPNYFRDTDSMNNYYLLESQNSSNVVEESLNSEEDSSDSENDQECMCSKVAEKLNNNIGCCCRNKSNKDEEVNCDKNKDILNTQYVDVETQNSRYLTSKANSFNISVHSKKVSAKLLDDFTLEQLEMESISHVFNSYTKDSSYEKNYQHTKPEDKVFVLNRHEVKRDVKKHNQADVLQSYETKKAVLEIYAEKANDGKQLVAKLPNFVYEREDEITENFKKFATNSYVENIVMSLRG